MTTAALRVLRALARWLAKIGRWLLEELVKAGAAEMAAYMRARARYFIRVAPEKRSPKWWRARARRWRRAADWLDGNWSDAAKALAKGAEALTRRQRRKAMQRAEDALARATEKIHALPVFAEDEREP